jgi:uncharacterized protein
MTDTSTTPEARNLARLQFIYAEYAKGNRTPLYESLAEDAVWRSDGDGTLAWSGDWHGLSGIQQYYARVEACAKVVGYDVEHAVAQGDWIFALATVHVRSLLDGETHPYKKVDVFRFRDGRIAEFREFYDTGAAIRRFCPG